MAYVALLFYSHYKFGLQCALIRKMNGGTEGIEDVNVKKADYQRVRSSVLQPVGSNTKERKDSVSFGGGSLKLFVKHKTNGLKAEAKVKVRGDEGRLSMSRRLNPVKGDPGYQKAGDTRSIRFGFFSKMDERLIA